MDANLPQIVDPGGIALPGGLEARPYQLRIIAQAIALLDTQVNSVLVESPTGSGKTVMGLAIARHLQRRDGLRVGWAAMRRNLLQQAEHENARGFGLDIQFISMFDKHPPHVDLLIVDEAQHDAALSMATLHGIIKPKKIIGLSATPFRSDRFKLCFEKCIRDASIHHLIQDGYLSNYHHYTIPLYAPDTVAQVYARDAARWGRSLIFFHRHADCLACARHLAASGVRCEVVSGASDRNRQIADFNAGKIDVLLAMLILAEGFDCPSLQTVFCRPSGKICTIQMCGRVLRRDANVPIKQIVQCEQTRYPFPRTAQPAEQYLWSQGAWRALKINRQIEAMCRRMQNIAAQSSIELPRLLKITMPRQRPLFGGMEPMAIDPRRDPSERGVGRTPLPRRRASATRSNLT